MVGAIQLAIMLGAAFGGFLLDHGSVTATFVGGATLLLAAAAVVGTGRRLQPDPSLVQPDGAMPHSPFAH